ncbi:Josephin-domain-containing protein [Phycomyces nitens]|nr:Josephin-domain-containing protein [Phycomyces nitens]
MDLVKDIFFEKQQGNLCAQHALNALLQGNYFTAVDLATIGQDLDREESRVTGVDFSGKKSQNYDDSGFFSIQVIQNALSIWNLSLVPWLSEEASEARQNPEQESAYICNLNEHWFTLRKFAVPWRWYNLNSTQSAPIHLSETYLGLLLQQIQNEGYSVFVVRGQLPDSIADRLAVTLPRPQKSNQDKKKTLEAFSGQGYSLSGPTSIPGVEDDEEIQLAKAIEASLQPQTQSVDELRKRRLARFGG